METKIVGDDMQALVVKLAKGDQMIAEAGSMMYKKGDVEVDAKLEGGIWGGIKRALTKESIFLVRFNANGASEVGFAPSYPGHIQNVKLSNSSLICQRDAFLCSAGEIEMDIALTKKLGFGFFGGEGFILQKLSGTGDVFVHAGGNFVEMELGDGETIDIDTGCIVAMEESIDYDIRSIGNIVTSIFAGEGLFVAHLEGPGKVWLQTLPFARMAEKIASAVGTSQGESRGVGGFGGKFLKDIISGK